MADIKKRYICLNLSTLKITDSTLDKARKIKAILFDVDGVLTDGGIIYDNNGQEFKRFNVKDGQIIKHLRKAGILTGVITGRDSPVVRNRCEELKIDLHHHGIGDKKTVFLNILNELSLVGEEVAYIGDDINDIPVLIRCGLSATPADGHRMVKDKVDVVLTSKGGEGALRELADMILEAQGLIEGIIEELVS